MHWFARYGVVVALLVLPQHALTFDFSLPRLATLLTPRSLSSSTPNDRTETGLLKRQNPFWALNADGSWSYKSTEDVFRFVTRPDISALRWDIDIFDHDALSPGYWFVAPYAHLEQDSYAAWNGPHIYNDMGELIWSGAPLFKHFNTFDFRTVEINDTHQFASLIFPENQSASGIVMDSTYNIRKALDLLGDLQTTNMHDFTIVNHGYRALTLTSDPGPASKEESEVIGFDGECNAVLEGFKGLDMTTEQTLFTWSSREHIGLDESTKRPEGYDILCHEGWDSMHLNSIDEFPDGDFLLSARHTDALYKISRFNGSIVWRLGGVRSDFEVESDARFSRQHHARVRQQNETHILISLFDNAIGQGKLEVATNEISRGLLLSLDLYTMKAHMLQHYDHPHDALTSSRGSLSFLPNGNAFLGWTYGSQISEHSFDGRLLMSAHFRLNFAHTYRAYKLPWIGQPTEPPSVVSTCVNFGNGVVNTLVHVSWNGATEVSQWTVYHCDKEGRKRDLMITKEKEGFETALWHMGDAKYLFVEGLDSDGNVLGRSDVIATQDASSGDVVKAEVRAPPSSPLVLLVIAGAITGFATFGITRCIRCTRPSNSRWKLWRPRNREMGYEAVAPSDEDEASGSSGLEKG